MNADQTQSVGRWKTAVALLSSFWLQQLLMMVKLTLRLYRAALNALQ